jgi:Fe-S-cluster-containing hydrogenase component 2
MMIDVNLKLCDECATCISVCPVDAIILENHIKVDEGKCISCGNCISVCPMGALTSDKHGNRNAPAAQGGPPQ